MTPFQFGVSFDVLLQELVSSGFDRKDLEFRVPEVAFLVHVIDLFDFKQNGLAVALIPNKFVSRGTTHLSSSIVENVNSNNVTISYPLLSSRTAQLRQRWSLPKIKQSFPLFESLIIVFQYLQCVAYVHGVFGI